MGKQSRIYRAHKNASFDDELAQWIGQQIDSGITSERFVALCRPKNSPGHKLFNWNLKEAAEAHWITRAEYHLRHVEIEIVDSGNKERIRACIPVYDGDEGSGAGRTYVPYDRIRESPNLARQVVEQAAHELKAWQRRYALYKSVFGSVFLAIEEMESELWPQQQQSTGSRPSTARTRKAKAR